MRAQWVWSVACALLVAGCECDVSIEPADAGPGSNEDPRDAGDDVEPGHDAGIADWDGGPSGVPDGGPNGTADSGVSSTADGGADGDDGGATGGDWDGGTDEGGDCDGDTDEGDSDCETDEGDCDGDTDEGDDDCETDEGDCDGDTDEGDGDGGPDESPGPPHEAPDVEGCTLSQGYWKNHAWPVSTLRIGSHDYTEGQLRTILWLPPRGDASVILAHQLIAALLNVENGASRSWAIPRGQQWMRRAGDWLPYGTATSSSTGDRAVVLADALAAYNEGRDGPPHCGSGGPPREGSDIEPPR